MLIAAAAGALMAAACGGGDDARNDSSGADRDSVAGIDLARHSVPLMLPGEGQVASRSFSQPSQTKPR